MKILIVGDIIGSPGRTYIKENLTSIKNKYDVAFTIANGENAAAGVGLDPKCAHELFDAGVDAITLGNHTWRKKDIIKILDDPRIVRPANYQKNVPGKGSRVITFNNKRIGIINAVGRVYMDPVDSPFIAVDRELENMNADIIIVDFHAEATSEKNIMGHYLDGRVTAVVGTHTHIQTADEKILPKGTGYITDIGMTGPKDSIIGSDKSIVMGVFITGIPERFSVAGGEVQLNAVLLTINDENNKLEKIERIFE